MSKDVNQIFDQFMNIAKEKQEAMKIEKEQNDKIIAEKAEILKPIRRLLKLFIKNKLVVNNFNKYKKNKFNREDTKPIVFSVQEGESSPSWQPGISLYIDHPVEIEIAIPNIRSRKNEGVVVIKCLNGHPLSDKINNTKCDTVEKACEILSELLISSIVSINTED